MGRPKNPETVLKHRKIVEFYKSGASVEDIANRTGYSKKRVYGVLNSNGLRLYSEHETMSEDDKKMKCAFNKPMLITVKNGLHIGDMVQVVEKKSQWEGGYETLVEECPVVEKSNKIFTVQRKGGRESFSYIDLAIGDGVRIYGRI